MKKLTERQRLFSVEYIKDFNASAASRRAGLDPAYGCKLVHKPHIKAQLQRLTAKQSERLIMDTSEVLERLTALARGENGATKAAQFAALKHIQQVYNLTKEESLPVVIVDDIVNCATCPGLEAKRAAQTA